MRRTQLRHIARVAEGAAKQNPELAQKFLVLPERVPYLEFQASARAILAEAQNQKELLVKHGLSEAVLEDLKKCLDEFDLVTEQSAQARAGHVGASIELDDVANEVVQVVNVMHGLNRFRFARDGELLSAWESVSNVVTSRPDAKPEIGGTPPTSGDVRPAA
jgi:hypothetical protein